MILTEITNEKLLSLKKKDRDWIMKLNEAETLLHLNYMLTDAERKKVTARLCKYRDSL
jgi:hypothetical protein